MQPQLAKATCHPVTTVFLHPGIWQNSLFPFLQKPHLLKPTGKTQLSSNSFSVSLLFLVTPVWIHSHARACLGQCLLSTCEACRLRSRLISQILAALSCTLCILIQSRWPQIHSAKSLIKPQLLADKMNLHPYAHAWVPLSASCREPSCWCSQPTERGAPTELDVGSSGALI